MFTVSNKDPMYNSAMIGNGEIVTTVGPAGYHNGYCLDEEQANRTIFWAGRRLKDARGVKTSFPRVPPEELLGPTIPLVRFGRFSRQLSLNGSLTTDDSWQQRMDYDRGMVISTLDHGSFREVTQSFVCLTSNILVFHTRLENRANEEVTAHFQVDYEFTDGFGFQSPGTRLNIRRPYPTDLEFGNVEGLRSKDGGGDERPPHVQENLKVMYEVQEHLGEVHIGRYPISRVVDTEAGGTFFFDIDLKADDKQDIWVWAIVSDRLKNTHFPDYDRVVELVESHEKAWMAYWDRCRIEFGEPELEGIYKAALYTLRCNASPWSNPPGYLSTHWEGRIFHDEFYPFIGLISANHLELARRIPKSRLLTLPHAVLRSAGRGAYYGWEVTEDGRESAPYGHWTDERFIHGQFSEQAYRVYLYTQNIKDLKRHYPVIKGCAEWMTYDVLERDEDGELHTRWITDTNEAVYPVRDSLYVTCAVIRCLENAANAAEQLDLDAEEVVEWRELAFELRKVLPVDEEKSRYKYSETTDTTLGAHHGAMINPFSFDVFSDLAWETMTQVHQAFLQRQAQRPEGAELVEGKGDNWIWGMSRNAIQCFYQGRGDEGFDFLRRCPIIVGPFMTPNEHIRAEKGPYLPWFSTGSGAYVHAINSMFVQVDEAGTILFPAVPNQVSSASFKWLLATNMVEVAGVIDQGKIVELNLCSRKAMSWSFRIPKSVAISTSFNSDVKITDSDSSRFVVVECALLEGTTRLI